MDLYNHLLDLQPAHPGKKRFRHGPNKLTCCIECRIGLAFDTFFQYPMLEKTPGRISGSKLYNFAKYYIRRQRMGFSVHPIAENHFPIFRAIYKATGVKPRWLVYGPKGVYAPGLKTPQAEAA